MDRKKQLSFELTLVQPQVSQTLSHSVTFSFRTEET